MENPKKKRKVAETAEPASAAPAPVVLPENTDKDRLRRIFRRFVDIQFATMKEDMELPENFDAGSLPPEAVRAGLQNRALTIIAINDSHLVGCCLTRSNKLFTTF